MKKYSKLFAILLSALLVAGIIFPLVMAESEKYEGQKELFIKNVTTPPVQDGILNGHQIDGVTVDEYGANGPTFCLTPADYRAIDLEGNPLDVELPSYIYLYMAKDADALYLGMEIQEEAHAGDNYEFTTFLGFGDKTDADTMNSGITTTFKMDNGNSPNFDPGTWMDTQVTALSAQKVAADGTVTDTTASRKFNNPVEYVLPAWGSETKSGSLPVTFFEAELDFEDAMLGSGLAADADLPDYGYFAFELGLFSGSEKIGKIVFNNDMTGKDGAPDGEIKTVPHLLNLKTEFNTSTANNANLSALSVEGGTLSPAFDANTTEYTVTLPNGTSSANVTATAAANETRVTVKGADKLDGITAGGNETITVTCVAQNGYIKTYTLNVDWAYDNTDYYVDATNGNDSTGTGAEDAPFATIEKALEAVAAKEWELSEMATVHINGTFNATVTDGVLWGAKTVFTKGATRLPITIQGDAIASDVIHAYAGKAACANSYHFDTLTFYIDKVTGAYLYAGAGQVRFDNVKWTTAASVSGTDTRFCGDSFTAKVFEGWTETEIAKAKSQNERGYIDTSITFGKNADYGVSGSTSGWYITAIGDSGGWDNTTGIAVKSTDMEVSAIIDGSSVRNIGIFTVDSDGSTTTYGRANAIMYDGTVHCMQSDTNSTSTCTINADVNIAVYGGNSYKNLTNSSGSYIRGARADTINGDLTVTVESGNWWLVQHAMGTTKITGNFTSNIGGTAVIGDTATANSGLYMCGQNKSATAFGGKVEHNVYGDAYISYVRLHGAVTVDKIVNNISGGTIYSYQPASNASVIGTMENNISGGTFTSIYYGSGTKSSGVKVDKVINNISGSATFNCEFRGTYHGTATVVENNISGGTFTTTYNGTYNSNTLETHTNISGGTFQGACYISYFELKESDLVKNTITGGTFEGTCLMGGYGGKIAKVENNISGGTFNGSGAVYLGAGSTTWPSVVDNIENTITGGTFAKRVYGGGWGSNVTGNIVNSIEGGSFGSYYGGIYYAYYNYSKSTNSSTGKISETCNMIGKSSETLTAQDKNGADYTYTHYKPETSPYYLKGVEGKVINYIGKTDEKGPSFSEPYFGGSLGSTRKFVNNEVVENNIYSGTWNSNFYGGGDSTYVKLDSVTNNVKGGTFNKLFIGGSYTSEIGTLTNNIEGGTFNGYFFGGSRRGNITGDVINNIKGGTWNSYFFGGSDQNSNAATAATGENGPITYTIGGSIKNTITGGTFKTAASGAGFGTITGNVENTIKGNPEIEFGYYGVQATLMDTVVEGNVLNLITKDENGVAPTFPKKNQAIDYVFDNADHTYVYTTDGSNIGFAATGASGTIYTDSTKAEKVGGDSSFTTVKGYVETIVEAGTFNGHYYLGGGVEIAGENADGYGAINIVRGDPVFNYVWAGGCVSSTREAAYKTYNEINGGTFNDTFSSYNRTATAGTYANGCEVVTLIKNGTFNDYVTLAAPWTDGQANQHQRTAPYTLTIEGGTFNADVYGLSYRNSQTIVGPFLADGGALTINVNGGTFTKNIYAAGQPYTADKFVENAVINIEPTKGDVTILGTVAGRFDKEIVNLKGGDYKLILGADAKIEATSATGDVKIGQAETWKKQTYVTLPEGNDAVVTVTGTHCLDKIETSVVAVKGGVQLAGATMILTDRVAVRALFDKTAVDSIDDFTFTFTMGEEILASGNKESLESYNDDYYCIVLAKIGANDFTSNVTFTGSELVWDYTFSIKGLAELAEDAWADNEKGVALAKAMQNFATIVNNPTAELPHTLAPDMSLVEGFEAKGTIDETTDFQVSGKGLIMGNAVGIRIYGTADSDVTNDYFTIKVNGVDVTDKALIAAGANAGEYTVDLYVNAKNMSSKLKIEIIEKATEKVCLELTDRVDAIAASYPSTHKNYALVQQLLVYIQAAVAYAEA